MNNPTDDLTIADDELVIRRIPQDHHIFDESIGRRRSTSQAFKQDGLDGRISVYLLSETTPEAVASQGSERYLVTVAVAVLRENNLGIIRATDSGGPGHCDIIGHKTGRRLRRIARQSQWVPGYAPPPGPDN